MDVALNFGIAGIIDPIIGPHACFWRDCHSERARKKCGACQKKRYCSKECQRNDWPDHKNDCGAAMETVVYCRKCSWCGCRTGNWNQR